MLAKWRLNIVAAICDKRNGKVKNLNAVTEAWMSPWVMLMFAFQSCIKMQSKRLYLINFNPASTKNASCRRYHHPLL
jgi:hypothetical protein